MCDCKIWCSRDDRSPSWHRGQQRKAWEDHNERRLSKSELVVPVCGDHRCCNPEHLKIMTRKELGVKLNETTRRRRGVEVATAVLDDEKVRAIRQSNEETSRLAKRYGVSTVTIHKVRTRQTWKHV